MVQFALLALVVLVGLPTSVLGRQQHSHAVQPPQWAFTESVPTQMNLTTTLTTASAVIALVNEAITSLDLAVMYWSLLPVSPASPSPVFVFELSILQFSIRRACSFGAPPLPLPLPPLHRPHAVQTSHAVVEMTVQTVPDSHPHSWNQWEQVLAGPSTPL
jgi:hypothetical protein